MRSALPLLAAGFAAAVALPPALAFEPYLWEQIHATRLPGGMLAWKPEPFTYAPGASVRYIDFENGDDARDGASPATAWRHHPWDAAATGRADAASGIHTYVFKGGVAYRGALVADDSGAPGDPIRLTRDPAWGDGPAVLQGSVSLTGGWRRVDPAAAPAHLPQPGSVWVRRVETDGPILSLWETRDGTPLRLHMARTPNWNPGPVADVQANNAVWTEVRPATGRARVFPAVQVGAPQAWASDRAVFNDPDPRAYDGAIVWTEYAGLMGSPYPIPVEEYDPARNAVRIASSWNDERKPVPGCRYFVEGLPRFLDAPGEYHHDAAAGLLYVRLPDDRDPNTTVVDMPVHTCLVDLSQARHVEVSGLTLRFQRTNQYYHRFWDIPAEDPVAIRIAGNADGIRIAHNAFEHGVAAVWAQTTSAADRIGTVVIADNDLRHLDRYAFRIAAEFERSGRWGAIDRVHILRNRIHDSGSRPRRAGHGHTVDVEFVTELVIAGNIVDRTYGSAIFLRGGKPAGRAEVPLTRMLVFQNQVVDTCLASNDWGGIETWQGGPAYVFDNVSLNAVGYWKYLDAITDATWEETKRAWMRLAESDRTAFRYFAQAMSVAGIYDRAGRNAYSARFAYALYMDGAFKQYWFNNIAGGASSDVDSPLCATGGIHAVAGSFLHAIFNNTFHRFGAGSAQGGTFPAPNLFLGNVIEDVGDLFLRHERARANPNAAIVRLPDADPERFAPGDGGLTRMVALGGNVFHGTPQAFGTFEESGTMWPDLETFRARLASYAPVLGTVGEMAPAPQLRDPAAGDFRPVSGSAAERAGARVFVPWAVYANVGEWGFHLLPAEPHRVVGEHWFMTREHEDRGMYRRLPRHDLRAVGVTAADYVPGVLEDWTRSALRLDGAGQHLVFPHADMTADIAWEHRDGKGSADGATRRTPNMDTNGFLLETVLRVESGWSGGLVAGKRDAQAGYALVLGDDGRPRLELRSGGAVVALAGADVRLNDGVWRHLLVEVLRDGDGPARVRFHVDGKPVETRASGPGLPAGASLANTGDFEAGRGLRATFDFLRVARGTLDDARTTAAELYAWQFHGPHLRTWHGRPLGQ